VLWLLLTAHAAELPEGWRPAPPPEGGYAAQYTYESYSSCSQSWSMYTVDAALTLELLPGGRATGCREHRAEDRNPDGRFITADLQSLSGRYTRDGDWIDLTLRPGGDRCGPARSTARTLPPWQLRCTLAAPAAGSALPDAALLCRFREPTYTESLGIRLYTMMPDDQWVLLGSAPGLSVAQDFGNDSILAHVVWTDKDGNTHSQPPPAPLVITPLAQEPTIGPRTDDLIFPD